MGKTHRQLAVRRCFQSVGLASVRETETDSLAWLTGRPLTGLVMGRLLVGEGFPDCSVVREQTHNNHDWSKLRRTKDRSANQCAMERLLPVLDASAMPLDFRHHRSIFAIRVQACDSFAQSCVDGRIMGIPVSPVQQHARHIPL